MLSAWPSAGFREVVKTIEGRAYLDERGNCCHTFEVVPGPLFCKLHDYGVLLEHIRPSGRELKSRPLKSRAR